MEVCYVCSFFVKQKTAYEMRISDWSSDVCSSDLLHADEGGEEQRHSDDAGGESRFVKKPGLDEGRLAATHPRPLLPGKKQDAGAGSGKARPGPRSPTVCLPLDEGQNEQPGCRGDQKRADPVDAAGA